jgi:hypothetical protein
LRPFPDPESAAILALIRFSDPSMARILGFRGIDSQETRAPEKGETACAPHRREVRGR